jgi:hypothetical protein
MTNVGFSASNTRPPAAGFGRSEPFADGYCPPSARPDPKPSPVIVRFWLTYLLPLRGLCGARNRTDVSSEERRVAREWNCGQLENR